MSNSRGDSTSAKSNEPSNSMNRANVVLWFLCAVLAGLCVWSATSGGVVSMMFTTTTDSAEKLERLKEYFTGFGTLAPVVYVGFVVVEVVVAPLPGAMLYAPGGIIFGPFYGGLLSLIGNTLGAGIACQLMRSVLGSWANGFFQAKSLEECEAKISKNAVLVIALLRLNPLTSSDIVSYAAGLTSTSVWKVMLGTMIGMAPLCWAQAWLADSLMSAFPGLFYPLLIGCVIYATVCVWVIVKLMRGSADAT